jgi:hypothetical protein
MERPPLIHVVILYLHPLLGEGLAKLLSAEPGVAVTAIREDDRIAAAIAIGRRPDVIVEERGERARSRPPSELDFSPLRLYVGIEGAATALRGEPMTADPEVILDAVRVLKEHRYGLVSA